MSIFHENSLSLSSKLTCFVFSHSVAIGLSETPPTANLILSLFVTAANDAMAKSPNFSEISLKA